MHHYDPDEHAEGVDRGIAERGRVAMDSVIGIAEGHGVGHAATKDAANSAEIKLLELEQYGADNDDRHHSQQETQDKPQSALGTDDSVEELRTRVKT